MKMLAIKRKLYLPILGILASTLLLGPQVSVAAAEEPTDVINGEFVPSDKLKAFKAKTFVFDFAPGLSVPLHSHPMRSQVLMLEGELTFKDSAGKETVYRKGDVLTMEANVDLSPTNTGKETARTVWTIVMPVGAP
jgi:quercetin dioxygenase-like cupin family protein